MLNVSSALQEEVKEVLSQNSVTENDKFIILNTGGNWKLKQWSKENFIELINSLSKIYTGKIILTGADKDIKCTEEIASLVDTKIIVLAGKTNLRQLIGIMQKADIVISADSGPLHIANSVGTDVIGIFGPTKVEITGPRGTGRKALIKKEMDCNQTACYNLRCPDNICMKAVKVSDVIDQFLRFIPKN